MQRLIEVVLEAGSKGAAIGHFNVADLVMLKGVFTAARELKTPVMVGASEGAGVCRDAATGSRGAQSA